MPIHPFGPLGGRTPPSPTGNSRHQNRGFQGPKILAFIQASRLLPGTFPSTPTTALVFPRLNLRLLPAQITTQKCLVFVPSPEVALHGLAHLECSLLQLRRWTETSAIRPLGQVHTLVLIGLTIAHFTFGEMHAFVYCVQELMDGTDPLKHWSTRLAFKDMIFLAFL